MLPLFQQRSQADLLQFERLFGALRVAPLAIEATTKFGQPHQFLIQRARPLGNRRHRRAHQQRRARRIDRRVRKRDQTFGRQGRNPRQGQQQLRQVGAFMLQRFAASLFIVARLRKTAFGIRQFLLARPHLRRRLGQVSAQRVHLARQCLALLGKFGRARFALLDFALDLFEFLGRRLCPSK
ncbi:hypothetical protein [Roseiterribacter gracilis]|uniref:hypothetical protein n=1 Tax=Roseiterribacter gracilis TaxID=2812848 RepID=UPI003B4296D4